MLDNIPHKDYIQYLNLSETRESGTYTPFIFKFTDLPFYLNYLSLPSFFNVPLKIGDFDGLINLKTLIFGKCFNDISINQEGILPINLENLEMGSNYSKPLLIKGLKYLKSVKLSNSWNLPLINDNLTLPNSVESLEFGYMFQQKINNLNCLPENLTNLNISGYIFNSEITALPKTLKRLELGESFNRELKIGVFPTTLEYLSFNRNFSKPLPIGVLNEGLKTLILSKCFNCELEIGSLPNTLTHLKLGSNYNHPLPKGVLPESLTKLEFDMDNSIEEVLQVGSIPDNGSLKELSFNTYFNHPLFPNMLPSCIKSFQFSSYYKHPLVKDVFPEGTESIIIYTLSKTPIMMGVFKNGLKRLTIKHPLDGEYQNGMFPDSLEYLCINDPISKGLLPNNLKELELYGKFKRDLNIGDLPSSLTKLSLLGNFDQILIKGLLPDSIQELIFGKSFMQFISSELLPSSLKNLTLSTISNGVIDNKTLPIGLETLVLNNLLKLSNFNFKEMKSLTSLVINVAYSNFTPEPFPNIQVPLSLENFEFTCLIYKCYGGGGDISSFSINGLFSNNGNLKRLHWNSNIVLGIGDIPNTVEYLTFGKNYIDNRFFEEGLIPNSVTNLNFEGFTPSSIRIPSSVQSLSINSSKLYTVDYTNSITDLNLSYNDYIVTKLPKNLDISKVRINFQYVKDDEDDYFF